MLNRIAKSPLLVGCLVVLVVLLVYWPGLSGGYLFDDYPVVLKNAQIRMEVLSWESLGSALGGFGFGEYGRPLATLSFAFNYWLGGEGAWGYKFTGVLLHALNAVIAWRLLFALLVLPRVGFDFVRARWWALSAAGLWALHPLQVSSVLYVVQRMEVLATTFVLLSLLAYAKGRSHQIKGERGGLLLFISCGAAGLGMLSKETAALAVVYAFCLEFAVLRFDAGLPATSRLLKRVYVFAGVFAAGVAVYICLKYANADVYAGRWFTMGERVLTQFRVLPQYMGQIVFPAPAGMYFYYDDIVASKSILDPVTTLFGLLLCASMLVLAIMRRSENPIFSLGVLWFFGAHAITSSPINLELMFEHRNYFALIGIVLVMFSISSTLPMGRVIAAALIICTLVGYAGLTFLRSATWGNTLLLATELAQENPRSARAATDLAEQYMLLSGMHSESPFFDLARKEYIRAAELPQASPLPEAGLMLMLGASGSTVPMGVWNSLKHKIRTNPLGVQEKLAVESLLMQYYDGLPVDVGQLDETIGLMLTRFRPEAPAYSKYADFILDSGRDDARAVDFYFQAYVASGDDKAYLARLERDLVAAGRADVAERLSERIKVK